MIWAVVIVMMIMTIASEGALFKPGYLYLKSFVLNLLSIGFGSGVIFFILAIILKILWS